MLEIALEKNIYAGVSIAKQRTIRISPIKKLDPRNCRFSFSSEPAINLVMAVRVRPNLNKSTVVPNAVKSTKSPKSDLLRLRVRMIKLSRPKTEKLRFPASDRKLFSFTKFFIK